MTESLTDSLLYLYIKSSNIVKSIQNPMVKPIGVDEL